MNGFQGGYLMLEMESPRYTKNTIGHVAGLLTIKVFRGFINGAYIFTRDNWLFAYIFFRNQVDLFALAHNALPHHRDWLIFHPKWLRLASIKCSYGPLQLACVHFLPFVRTCPFKFTPILLSRISFTNTWCLEASISI